MAGQTQKSKLMGAIGPVGAVVKKRLEQGVDNGFQPMPPGVREGVAKVDNVVIAQVAPGKQGAGDWYFRASAVAQEPEYVGHNGTQVKVRGKTTSVFIMLKELKNKKGEVYQTMDQAKDFVVNHLLMMGAEELLTEDCDLGEVANAVKARADDKAAPPLLIKFSTNLSKPSTEIDPKTGKPYPQKVKEYWHEYDGDASTYEAPEPSNADGSPAAEDNTEFSEFSELEQLVSKADNNDGSAQAALREKAKELGETDETLDDEKKYPSWESIAEFVKAGVPVTAEEPEPSEPWKPAVGKCKYKGKVHEIIAVQGRSKTVHLKGLVSKDKKPVPVKFDEVSEA